MPFASALLLSFGLAAACFLLVGLPVFMPSSTFYGPTISRSSGVQAEKAVALSFDDGPDPRYTRGILDYLDSESIKAIFFVVGKSAKEHPDLIREIIERGHIIGNHSYSHSHLFHFSSKAKFLDELRAFDQVIGSMCNVRCRFYRPPQGFRTPLLADLLKREKLLNIAWSNRGFDTTRTNPQAIFASLKKNLRPGSIILMHDGAGFGGRADRIASLEALGLIVREVKERGYSFQRLDRLIEEAPYFG